MTNKTECTHANPPSTPPTDETLGIYSANGHAVYDPSTLRGSLVIDRDDLESIWEKEVRHKGVDFKSFVQEVTQQGSDVVKEASLLYLPWLDQIATLPGNVRIRYIRICVCWRWICIYVWVKI